MVSQFTPLYYICSVAGLVMVVGGIVLIYKQKIYIDRETNQVTEIDVPVFGRFKTNVPALALFVIGFIPLIYPIYKSRTDYVYVNGKVASQLHPVIIYSVVQMKALQQDGSFSIPVPVIHSDDYTPQIIYLAGSSPFIVFDDPLELTQQRRGKIQLPMKEIVAAKQQVGSSTLHPDIVAPPAEFKP